MATSCPDERRLRLTRNGALALVALAVTACGSPGSSDRTQPVAANAAPIALDDKLLQTGTSVNIAVLGNADQLESVLPPGEDYLALTLYTNALLEKSRLEVSADDFSTTYAINRSRAAQAFGYDILTTRPANPAAPDPTAGVISLQYAQMIGAAANVINDVTQRSGQVAIAFNVIDAFVRDFADCRLDGVDAGGPVQFLMLGVQRNMPTELNLNLEALRFRNNSFSSCGAVLGQYDESLCSQTGAVADTAPPAIARLGADPVTVLLGALYDDSPGATASDLVDGDLTASIVGTGFVDTATAGDYTLYYDVADSSGNHDCDERGPQSGRRRRRIHIDTGSLAAPNFRPMPEIYDNVYDGNVDAGGASVYSINNLPSWGQQEWHENLMDDAGCASTKDSVIADLALEFGAGWYLQPTSQGVDLSQVNASSATKYQAIPERTTDESGAVDSGKADAGYHYAAAYVGPAATAISDARLLGNAGTVHQDLRVTLLDSSGDRLSLGNRVALEIAPGSAPVNLNLVSTAVYPLDPPAATVAIDVGDGDYKLEVDTNGVVGPDVVYVDVYVDGLMIDQVAIPLDP